MRESEKCGDGGDSETGWPLPLCLREILCFLKISKKEKLKLVSVCYSCLQVLFIGVTGEGKVGAKGECV